jgi:glycosyltransferase involved in cell wall biosynthesis
MTSVPGTLIGILKDQPKYLQQYFDITLVSSNEYELSKYANQLGIKYYALGFLRRKFNPLFDLLCIIEAAFLFLRLNPDFIHSYTPKAGLISALSGFLARIPLRIHTFTGLIFPNRFGIKKKIYILFDKIICNFLTHIVAEGKGVQNDLKQYITKRRVHLIGNGNIAGVNLSFFDYKLSPKHLGFDESLFNPKKFNILFVGRVDIEKGIFDLIDSVTSLNQQFRNEYDLHILGSIELSGKNLLRFREYTQYKFIHYYGNQSDVRPYLIYSDVLVLPSYREGFPNVLLQAGAMKKISISSDISGSNEIILDGVNGFLFKPKNIPDLRRKINFVKNLDFKTKEKMSSNALTNIQSKFDEKLFRAELINFYNSVLKKVQRN